MDECGRNVDGAQGGRPVSATLLARWLVGGQEEDMDDEGDWRGGDNHGVGGATRRKEEAPTKARALEGEAGDHHDGIKSALWFCFCFFLFVCVFDMFACSSSFVLSYHKKMPPPLLGSRLVYVCVANCGSFVQLDRVTVVLYFGW